MRDIPTIDLSAKPGVTSFFDQASNTFSYVVKDPASQACAIVDPVMEIDMASGRISYEGADKIIQFVTQKQLKVEWLIETHVHADHLTASAYLQSRVGGKIGIGAHVTIVQDTFGKIFNAGTDFARNGTQFDHLFEDGEHYQIGGIDAVALHTPGHTPACMTHVVGDAGFVGDTLFMPDAGTARADFPGGDARTLFQSVRRILSLPDITRLFMCHDYQPNGRELKFESTVAEQKANNIHVAEQVDADAFVEMREKRDATLAVPQLILPSLQINMRAGQLPPAEDNDMHYLKIPLNAL